MRDEVDVDVAGVVGHRRGDARSQGLSDAAAPADADDDLGGVDPAGVVEDGVGDVVPRHLVELGPEVSRETAQARELGRVGRGEPVRGAHVAGDEVSAGRAGGDPGAPPQEGLAARASGQGDDDALAGRPGVVDALVGAVALEGLVDAVGEPQQGDLTQGREVADPEVVGQSRVDGVGTVDVAVGHPAAQRLG